MSNRVSDERLAQFRKECADDRQLGEKDGLQAGMKWAREAGDLYSILEVVDGEAGIAELGEEWDLDWDELLSRQIIPQVYQEGYRRGFAEGVREVYRQEILPALPGE